MWTHVIGSQQVNGQVQLYVEAAGDRGYEIWGRGDEFDWPEGSFMDWGLFSGKKKSALRLIGMVRLSGLEPPTPTMSR